MAVLLLGLGATGGLWGCFDGSVTLGAACENTAQCGDGQSCVNTVCGLCGDGKAQRGEVCFGPATERVVEGTVSTMLAITTSSGLDVLVLAANGDCGDFGLGPAGTPCFRAVLAIPDGEGDVVLVSEETGLAAQGSVDAMATGDFNGDGELDLVAALGSRDQLRVGVASDDPDAGVDVVIALPAGTNPTTVYTADLDGDGDDDIVAGAGISGSGGASTEVGVVLSNGDGTFQTPVAYGTTAIPRVAPPADMDGDGDLDLVVVGIDGVSQVGSSVQVLDNDGTGKFSAGARTPLSVAVLPWATAIGDLDGDEVPDLVVTLLTAAPGQDAREGYMAVLRGDGEGGFAALEEYVTGKTPVFVALRDINGDDELDALVANADDDKVSFFLNAEGGELAFGDQQQLDVGFGPIAILAAHLDDNDVEDLAVTTSTGELSISFSEF